MQILSAILFFPRGGSAQVARALASDLPAHGCEVRMLSGSLGSGLGDARKFYEGLDLRVVDFDAGDAPMHPSYEDRPGAPDRCFALLDDEEYGAQVHAWSRAMESAGAAAMDAIHLHHLTPMNEAVQRVAPDVPVVGHLHGTELMMLERIAAGPPESWKYAQQWSSRMRRWASACNRLIVHTEDEVADAAELLEVDPSKLIVVPNGFDPEKFIPAPVDRSQFWRRHLVEEPQGWLPGEPAGSLAYSDEQVGVLDDAVVLIATGRFTELKRLGLLIRAFEEARVRSSRPLALVLLGGHPGEWEGEHPVEAIADSGARNVFLAGWHDHSVLAGFFNAADVQILASIREQFGLVLVEGMGCALPPIAVDRFGPRSIIDDGETGWLVPPDDRVAMSAAILDATGNPDERCRRGIAGRRVALELYAWPAIAGDVNSVIELAAGSTPEPLPAADAPVEVGLPAQDPASPASTSTSRSWWSSTS